jgi:hypothetical protein
MDNKLVFTSFVALCFACPAMATPGHTSSSFPNAANGEYMQEDYSYTNAATSTNMAGVYANNATVYAQAIYQVVAYTLTAGNYLPKNSETLTTCKIGYYCPGTHNGSSTVYYSTTTDQGIVACPEGWPDSTIGAKSATSCYRGCTASDVAHAATVTGIVKYNPYTQGDGATTCIAKTCVNGYHVNVDTCQANTINITWYGASSSAINANNAGTATYDGDIRTPQSANTVSGKRFVGWKFTATQPDVQHQVLDLDDITLQGPNSGGGTGMP